MQSTRIRRPQSASNIGPNNNKTKLTYERDDHVHLPWDKCLEFDLPTHRHHIMQHPTTIVATQHTVTHELDTQWTKITQTPWTRKGKLCGGYGRRINVSHLLCLFPNESIYPITAWCRHPQFRTTLRHFSKIRSVFRSPTMLCQLGTQLLLVTRYQGSRHRTLRCSCCRVEEVCSTRGKREEHLIHTGR
jgi:hypothetical protein